MTFHDIFSKNKNKSAQKQPIKIIADIHEKNSMIFAELTQQGVELEIRPLKIADYLVGNIAIERKTVQDFISSMINKRLIQQLHNLQKYKQRILIIEGIDEDELYKKDTKLNPNAVRGFILSIIFHHQTPIIFTQNYQDTAQFLITLAKQQLKSKTESSFHSRIPKNPKHQKQYILESFPNIGPATAKKLLGKYKTLKNIFSQTQEELKKDIGKKAETFKLIDEDY